MSQWALFCLTVLRSLKFALKTASFFGASIRLGVLFAAAIAITSLLANRPAPVDAWFQSPASPVEQPQPAEPQQPQPTEPAQPAQPQQPQSPEPAQPAQPQQPQPAEPTQPAEGAPQEPAAEQESQQPVQSQQSPQPETAEEAVAPVTPAQPEGAAEGEPLPPPLPEPEQPPQEEPFREEEPGESSLIVDQAEMIDTVVVSTAYVWLCCGIILILLVPLVFLFLHIRGRSKIIKTERF